MMKVCGKPTTARLWAITGLFMINEPGRFFYTGMWLSRQSAIEEHARVAGLSWRACRARGDRAVQIDVVEVPRREP